MTVAIYATFLPPIVHICIVGRRVALFHRQERWKERIDLILGLILLEFIPLYFDVFQLVLYFPETTNFYYIHQWMLPVSTLLPHNGL